MSKIALSGNASGTGTFTIASPNSNSDRTLSLPDAAGEMYNQGNILGTVSESSGVPTGAIIEGGSNANGEYVKYADGTMICTGSPGTAATNNLSSGSIYNGTASWTFPATFSSPPTGVSAVSSAVRWGGNFGSVTTTSANLLMFAGSSSSTQSAIRGIAIGRWY
jgi:hypothetical protein